MWLSRGFGWDAYVVVGLVDTRTATLDQSHLACPLLTEELETGEAGEAQGSARPQLYRLQEPVALVSRFQQFLASREESGQQGAATTAASRDSGHQQTLHGWVYVETDNLAFFIEPTTGQRHSIASAAYIKINCLFNDQNYWLNLKEGNLSRKGKKLELDNKSKWLRLIQEVSNKKKPKQEKKTTEIGIGLMKENFLGGVRVELILIENIFYTNKIVDIAQPYTGCDARLRGRRSLTRRRSPRMFPRGRLMSSTPGSRSSTSRKIATSSCTGRVCTFCKLYLNC